MFLKVAAQTMFPSDVGSRFQAGGPVTENALEPTVNDTSGTLYCPLPAEHSTWKHQEWYDSLLKVSCPRIRM